MDLLAPADNLQEEDWLLGMVEELHTQVVGACTLHPEVVGILHPEVAGILRDIQYVEVAGEALGDLAREPAFLLLLTCLIND
jgi:hypothetical protein